MFLCVCDTRRQVWETYANENKQHGMACFWSEPQFDIKINNDRLFVFFMFPSSVLTLSADNFASSSPPAAGLAAPPRGAFRPQSSSNVSHRGSRPLRWQEPRGQNTFLGFLPSLLSHSFFSLHLYLSSLFLLNPPPVLLLPSSTEPPYIIYIYIYIYI